MTRITLDSLEYCEVQGRTLVFHLLDGTVIESSGSMDELARQLADYPGFLRPHRSYLVNMEYIQNITAKSITMESLAEVPLPHGALPPCGISIWNTPLRERRSSCDRPGILPEVLDGAAVGIFGILLSAAFCPIRWTGKKRWALAGCTAGLLALQGIFYFGTSPTAAQYLYPLITHLPLYLVLVLFSGQKVWPLVAVLTAYLCCQVRRWAALAVALFFRSHRWCSRWLSCCSPCRCCCCSSGSLPPPCGSFPATRLPCSASLASCRWWVISLITSPVSTPAFCPVQTRRRWSSCSLCAAQPFVLYFARLPVERQRIQMEQLQTSLNLQVTQAMREIEALRLSQQRASTYRHDLRHHMQFLAGCIENGRTEQALGYIRSVCSEIEAGKVTVYCENEAANLIFSAFADRAAKAGVQFTVQAGISQKPAVSESDLCVLLSNALENALHAAVRCREAGHEAFIETSGHEKGHKLFLQITNSCLPDVQFREGVPVTDRTRSRAWGAQHLRHLRAVRRPDQLCRKGWTIHPAGNVIR